MSTDHEYAALADHLAQTTTVGRYVLHRQIARGGMATIHIARLMGDEGFSRIVAAKRLHPEFAEDSEFVAMFLDEARIASKVHHRNVVPVLDVVTTQDEVLLVQELVHGAPLNWLLNKSRQVSQRIPVDIAVGIATQILAGLHAAHEMVDEMGMPLHVVHRDVSPQNVMIASDGTARLLDFGVAKATMAAHTTREGTYKGKLAYSAPEQLRGQATKQSDIYALAVVLWELIVGHRMHGAQSETELVATIMNGKLPTILESLAAEREWQAVGDDSWKQLEAVDAIVKRGLSVEAAYRFATAAEMEETLTRAVPPATPGAIAAWLRSLGKEYLEKQEGLIAAEEASWRRTKGAAGMTRPNARLRTQPGIDSISRMSQPSVGESVLHHPPAPDQPRSRTMVALMGALAAGVAIGVVMLLKSPSAESRPPEPTPPPAVERTAPIRTLPQTAREDPAPPPSTDDEPDETAPATAPAVDRTVAPRPQVARVKAPPVRPPTKTVARAVEPKPEAVAPPTPAPQPVAAPADKADKIDCTPPYYYEGSKKIFKPACL